MRLGVVRTDSERPLKSVTMNAVLNPEPTEPQHVNWNLRPRSKALEVGPEFRLNSHLQVERLIDKL